MHFPRVGGVKRRAALSYCSAGILQYVGPLSLDCCWRADVLLLFPPLDCCQKVDSCERERDASLRTHLRSVHARWRGGPRVAECKYMMMSIWCNLVRWHAQLSAKETTLGAPLRLHTLSVGVESHLWITGIYFLVTQPWHYSTSHHHTSMLRMNSKTGFNVVSKSSKE